MKQKITIAQLQELTEAQKQKLQDWWNPVLGEANEISEVPAKSEEEETSIEMLKTFLQQLANQTGVSTDTILESHKRKNKEGSNEIMNVEVVKEFAFDAAHFLPGYDGKCGNLHGHRWVLRIGFKGPINPETGMIIDFSELKSSIDHLVIDTLDHKFLNELAPKLHFPKNPTAENILEWIIWRINHFSDLKGTLSFVRVYETPTSYAEWRMDTNA
jgi:6-pyruvoyltetrahydropterin/6-carboxytetrahydropterin synthase